MVERQHSFAIAASDQFPPVKLTRGDWLTIALGWALLCGYYWLFAAARDVDDTLRLLEVRDWLAGQSWFDLHQDRVAPPGGVPMHWSRLVDLPLAGAMLLARLFTSPQQAEQVATFVVPLVTMGCAAALIYRLALALTVERKFAVLAMLLGLTAAPMGQLAPGRIDHHGWQLVLALAALNAMLGRDPRRCGWIIGAALAAWLAISIEGLPLTAAFLGVLGLRWLHDRAERGWLVHASAALALVSAALWLATHRIDAAALFPWCDVVTPLHLAALAWTALGTAVVARLPLRTSRTDLLALGVVAAGALAIFALGQPQCLRGGFSQVDPLVATVWLSFVGEASPLWTRPLAPAITMATPCFLGVAAMTWLVWRWRRRLPFALLGYFLLLLAATIVACLIVRAFALATAFAAPPLAWGLREWLRALQREERTGVRLLRILGVALAAVPWLLGLLVQNAVRAEANQPRQSCDLASRAAWFQRLPTGTFLTPFDIGPELLVETRHRILASGHHRASAAMRDALDALMGSPETAQDVVERRAIDYVAVCVDDPEVEHLIELAPNGLLARLERGDVPPWLAPLQPPGPHAPKVWRIVR